MDFDVLTQDITPETLKAEMAARLAESGMDVDTREGSYTDQIYSEVAYQIYKGLSYHPTLLAAAIPSAESGPYLDKFGAIFGLTRTPAATAYVVLTFTGEEGTVIPKGTVAVSSGGLRFTTDLAASISGGTAEVPATAEQSGEIYNVAVGTVTRLAYSLPGISQVTNETPGEGGADAESDGNYYERIHTRLSKPVGSGNPYYYEQLALTVPGVGQAKTISIWDGPGTVKVLVASEDKQPLDGLIVAQVQQVMDEGRIIGADVTVVSAQALAVDVEATCTLEGGVVASDVQKEMEEEIQRMLLDMEMGAQEPVRYNRILAMLLSCKGVVDCTSLTVNSGSTNIPVTVEQVPVLGTVVISTS